MDALLTADLHEYRGRCGDVAYEALLLHIEGLDDPHMLTLSLPASTCRGLADRVKPEAVYRAIVRAINASGVTVQVA